MEAEEHLGAHDLLNQKVSCKQNGRTGERALSLFVCVCYTQTPDRRLLCVSQV